MAGLKGKQNVRAQKNLWYVYGFNVGGTLLSIYMSKLSNIKLREQCYEQG